MADDAVLVLPSEIDFSADRAASPERMNRATRYLLGQIRAAQAQVKTYQDVIDELHALGLGRVTDVLTPIFTQAQATLASSQTTLAVIEDNAAAIQTYRDELQALPGLATIDSPHFTGIATFPTAPPGTNTDQVATTAFCAALVAGYVGAAPENLNSFQEFADALGDDPNFATTILTQLGLKAALVGPQTISQTEILPRVHSALSQASAWAWNSDSYDAFERTAQAADLTINPDAAAPANFRKRIMRFTASGATRAITFQTAGVRGFADATGAFQNVGTGVRFVIPSGQTAEFGLIYSASAAKWRIVGVSLG